MMVIIWRNARLEKRKAAAPRKLHGAVEVETGWQVFPLPAPPTLMSSVGTRRSTRVLIPKISSVARVGDGVSSVLGSPKTLAVRRHGDTWLGVFGDGGAEDHRCEKREKGETRDLGCSDGLNEPGETAGKTPESDVPEDSCDTCLGRKFGIVYGRRRQRQLSGGGASTSSSVGHRASEIKRRNGLVFVRKGCRRKSDVPTLHQEIKREPELAETSIERGIIKRELKIAVSAGNFAKKNGILENSLCTNINDRMVLTLFVESSCASSSLCFPRFLITALKWMRRSTVTVQEFAAFLLSGSLATVFSRQGVHVLPLRWQKNNVVFSGVLHCCGLCKIYGARQSVPLLLLDFSALPIYFRSLHVSMLLGSLYLPRVLTRYLMCLSGAVNYEENDSCVLVEAGNLGTELSMVPVTVRHEQNDTIDACKSAIENATNLLGSGLSKCCGRRSFSGGWNLSGAVNYEENDSCVLVEAGNLGIELSMVPVTVRHEQNDTIDACKSTIENATNLGSGLSKRCGRRSFSGGWNLSGAVNYEENDSCVLVEAGNLETELSMVPVTMRHEQNDTIDACKSAIENATNLLGSGLNKHCGRRSFSGSWSLLSSNADALLPLHSNQCGASGLSEAKASFHAEFMAKPICPEMSDACTEKVLSSKYESDVSTLFSSHRKQRKLANKELKSALAEVKKNIDTSRCNANVLVVDADRCWREEGFEVLLDALPSKEWRIAVKSQGETKYLHKPLNMRRCVVNRFTHTYIWAAEDRWKLEFLDRWDWLVFKELHEECQQRNLQEDSSRTISVPVYREVSGYADGSRSTFIRPDYYIRTEDDEIQRALSSKIARYDMDSGDEKWLTDHNSGILHPGLGELKNISADDFDKIIYAMEKGAYSNVDHVFDKEKAFKFCQDLGKREILGAIYDYWEKKRNKKQTALVREFQSPPLLRSLLVHTPFLRKKRSFKR
uniref:Enhancer of polycomb-like protein n=1 Tax=Musa acuminata subsp. malaccensis TaxID=214687 RepID=A0A804L812_MUSAM